MLNTIKSRAFTVPQATNLGPDTDGASAPINISDLTGAFVNIASTGTISAGTIAVQVSSNGSTWKTVGTPVQDGSNVLNGIEALTSDYPLVRVKCTENIAGGGSVTADVCGRRANVQV